MITPAAIYETTLESALAWAQKHVEQHEHASGDHAEARRRSASYVRTILEHVATLDRRAADRAHRLVDMQERLDDAQRALERVQLAESARDAQLDEARAKLDRHAEMTAAIEAFVVTLEMQHRGELFPSPDATLAWVARRLRELCKLPPRAELVRQPDGSWAEATPEVAARGEKELDEAAKQRATQEPTARKLDAVPDAVVDAVLEAALSWLDRERAYDTAAYLESCRRLEASVDVYRETLREIGV